MSVFFINTIIKEVQNKCVYGHNTIIHNRKQTNVSSSYWGNAYFGFE